MAQPTRATVRLVAARAKGAPTLPITENIFTYHAESRFRHTIKLTPAITAAGAEIANPIVASKVITRSKRSSRCIQGSRGPPCGLRGGADPDSWETHPPPITGNRLTRQPAPPPTRPRPRRSQKFPTGGADRFGVGHGTALLLQATVPATELWGQSGTPSDSQGASL